VERVGAIGKAAVVVIFGLLHIHIHHKFHGPTVDYATLAVAVVASWAGLPGPGEPVLFAAGVLAANHRLDIASVLAVAFVTAVAGGVAGWVVGLKFGRALITAPGPLRKLRIGALRRGEAVFKRYVAIAIFLAPSWVAGIHGVRTSTYMFWNAFWALVWTLVIGLGAFYAGPPILDVLVDLGWIGIAALVLLMVAGVALELRRRRTRRGVHGPAPG
jgi:membrane protein DedA with SNARE-associated domain